MLPYKKGQYLDDTRLNNRLSEFDLLISLARYCPPNSEAYINIHFEFWSAKLGHESKLNVVMQI